MPITDNGQTTTVSELKIGQDSNAVTLKINSSGQLLIRNYDDSAAGDIVLDDVTQDAGVFNTISVDGVTSTGTTGTGKLVFDTAPTLGVVGATSIKTADGTGAAPSHSFTNEPDTGMFLSGANAIGFATGGTERWIINSSGALNPLTDNANDIGNGTVNPRDVNISRAVKVHGTSLIGTAGAGTVAIATTGDGRDFTTVLTLTNFIVGALDGAAAAKGIGNKVFTFPAGAHLHHATYMSIGLTAAGTTNTPDLGIGSVIATGVVSVLGGTATFEDYITGQTAPDLAGGVVAKTSVATAGALTGISINESGSVKDVFLNAAATWAADNTGNLTATGTITLRWTKLS